MLIVALIGITSLRIFTTGPNGGTCMLAAHCGEDCPRSEMLVLEEEQGSPAPGAIERTLLDYTSTGHAVVMAALRDHR